jgi:hypothetical protein
MIVVAPFEAQRFPFYFATDWLYPQHIGNLWYRFVPGAVEHRLQRLSDEQLRLLLVQNGDLAELVTEELKRRTI